jgi:hypothetical protein
MPFVSFPSQRCLTEPIITRPRRHGLNDRCGRQFTKSVLSVRDMAELEVGNLARRSDIRWIRKPSICLKNEFVLSPCFLESGDGQAYLSILRRGGQDQAIASLADIHERSFEEGACCPESALG